MLTLISVSVLPLVTAVARKDSCHSAKCADGGLQLKTHATYICRFECTDTVTCVLASVVIIIIMTIAVVVR